MFKFRLQRILELREQHEQAKARALAGAQDVANSARADQSALAALRDDSQALIHATTHAAPRVGHLWQLDLALTALEVRMERAAEVVHEAEAQVVTAQEALAAAAKDRRVLDRLKERHAESYRAEFALKDRIAMDEIALAQFTRRDDDAPHPAPDDTTTHSLPSSSPRPTDRPTR